MNQHANEEVRVCRYGVERTTDDVGHCDRTWQAWQETDRESARVTAAISLAAAQRSGTGGYPEAG